MELRHLRYFIGIVECRGYRQASRMLHVAQPALSQTVLDLEYEIGAPLLIRGPQQITLTPAGESFYRDAKDTLQRAEQAINTARRAARDVHGSLTIGLVPGTAQHFLPELLSAFRARHPLIKLNVRGLSPAAQLESLQRGDVDLAFTREVPVERQPYLSSRPLFEVPLMAVSRTTRKPQSGSLEVASLAAERLVLLDRIESPLLFDSILDLCHDAGFTPQAINQTHLAESILTLVQAGEGIAIVPMCAHVFDGEGLERHRLTPDTVRVKLVAAWANTSPSVPLREFLDLLTEEIPRIEAATDTYVIRDRSSPE